MYRGRTPDKKADPCGYRRLENAVLEHTVVYEVARSAADESGFNVTDGEIRLQIDLMQRQSMVPGPTDLGAALQAAGPSLEQLERFYEELLLIQKVHSQVTIAAAGPSEAEIVSFCEAHKGGGVLSARAS